MHNPNTSHRTRDMNHNTTEAQTMPQILTMRDRSTLSPETEKDAPGDELMYDISDWRAKAKFILGREKTGPSVLMIAFGKLPHGVLYEVMENTAALLKEKHNDAYDTFAARIDCVYRLELENMAKEKARTTPGDPAALIQFPGKGGKADDDPQAGPNTP